jgi:hypothetical protein
MDDQDFQTLVLERISDLKSDVQDFKADVGRQFAQARSDIGEFKTDVNRRFDESNSRMEHIEQGMDRMEQKLDAVYEVRDRVKIIWGWQWGLVSFVIALGAAGMTKILS